MLENVNLKRRLSRDEYDHSLPGLQRRLYDLEKACWDHKIPSVILLEGWDAAGKGGAIASLTQRLDPRGFKVHGIHPPRTFEHGFPWLWRFWLKTPERGEMVIFDQSWYGRVLHDRVFQTVSKAAWRAAFRDIVDFERMLADDGAVILKFFLHISRKEQKRRFRKMEENPLEAWRVGEEDHARQRQYDEYLIAIEEMLELTETAYAPWTIVEATSRWWARKKIFETVIAALEHRLGRAAPPYDRSEDVEEREADLREAMSSLDADSPDPSDSLDPSLDLESGSASHAKPRSKTHTKPRGKPRTKVHNKKDPRDA
jgi:polyphosphate kinase 2 (PPK2 family)